MKIRGLTGSTWPGQNPVRVRQRELRDSASTVPQSAMLLSTLLASFYHLYSELRGQYDGGRAGSTWVQPPKHLCVQESLNFINRSKCKEEYGCKDDSVTAG